MKFIRFALKSFQVFLLSIVSLVIIDMFILHGKLKVLFIALANTSDYSPFSTDGQMNFIFIFFALLLVFSIAVFLKLNLDGSSFKCDVTNEECEYVNESDHCCTLTYSKRLDFCPDETKRIDSYMENET